VGSRHEGILPGGRSHLRSGVRVTGGSSPEQQGCWRHGAADHVAGVGNGGWGLAEASSYREGRDGGQDEHGSEHRPLLTVAVQQGRLRCRCRCWCG
jgi:hypothetical protein